MISSKGRITGIYIGSQKGGPKTETPSAELIADHGLRGDSHAGVDRNRQVSLFAVEVLRELQQDGFDLSPEKLSANLFTQDIGLDALEPGSRLSLGESILEIVEQRKPCRSITRIDNRLPKKMLGKCGQLARIIKGSIIHPGDQVAILPLDLEKSD